MVIDQTRKGGFRFRTIDEIEENRAHLADQKGGAPSPVKRASTAGSTDKKGSEDEYVEAV